MKSLKLFLFLFVALTAFSCSSDDDDGFKENTAEDILGRWNYVRTYVDGEIPNDHDEYLVEDHLIFHDNGTVEVVYIINGEEDVDLFKYKFKNDKLTVNYANETATSDVMLTDSSLSVITYDDYYEDGKERTIETQYKR